jgi:hypothetical protein
MGTSDRLDHWVIRNFKEATVSFLSNKYNLMFVSVLLFALVIRLRFFFIESLWNDETFYIWYAVRSLNEPLYLLSERVITHSYYSFMSLIMFFKLFVNDALLAGRLAALVVNLFGIVLIYLLGSEFKDKATGLAAAILLSVHHIYWFIGGKVLVDAPLATAFIFVAYALIKFEKEKDYFWAAILGFSIAICVNTKLPGAIVFVILGTYFFLSYIVTKDPVNSVRKLLQRKDFWAFIVSTSIFLTPTATFNLLKFGSIVANKRGASGYALSLATEWAPTYGAGYMQSLYNLPMMLTLYVVPFVFLGVLFCLVYRDKKHWLILSFASYYVIYTILTGGAETPRYFLPAFPFMLLLAAYALFELRLYMQSILKIKLNRFIFIFIVLLLAVPLYQQGLQLHTSKQYSYTGYQEAGAWISENVPEDGFVFAGSPGFIRLFSGYEFIPGIFGSEGSAEGILYYGFPVDRASFEEIVREESKTQDIYLEVDIWEYKNQQWVYPLDQEKIDYFYSLGFEVVNVIERDVATSSEMQKVPVILMLKLESTS